MVPCVTEGLCVLGQAGSLENRGPVVRPEAAGIREARRQWLSHTVQVGRAFSDKACHPEGQVTTVTMTSPTADVVRVPPMCQEPCSLISSSSPHPLQGGDYDSPHFIEKEMETHRGEATSQGQTTLEGSCQNSKPSSFASSRPVQRALKTAHYLDRQNVSPTKRLSQPRCY